MNCAPPSDDRGTFAEMIAYLRISERNGRRLVKDGEIDSFRIGNRCYFSGRDISKFELKLARFEGQPHERERLERESIARWSEYLRSSRGAAPSADQFSDLLRRIESIERFLSRAENFRPGSQDQTKEVAAA